MHPSAEVSFYCSDPYASGSSYDCAYFPSSAGNADATASVDLGSPGVVASAKKEEGRGWFGWIRGTVSNVGHRVAERAKTSMDSMITTLDPQMKEFLLDSIVSTDSGGDMDIIVASDKEVKVGAIREAFQMSFGKATVCGMKTEAQGIAAQPVGFEAALSAAEGRINYLRSTGRIHPQHPIVAVENFIVELQSDWYVCRTFLSVSGVSSHYTILQIISDLLNWYDSTEEQHTAEICHIMQCEVPEINRW
ncbi:Protein PRRC1 [Portunus trituberculatus]|uniref:Protein PRRC1 n=1 Tax=Portunus trituberculatus TaxID=210409 RepID=A0A5B7GIB1_PORTR|nr:Protein PRRC1 [Portunus trituberculatus]